MIAHGLYIIFSLLSKFPQTTDFICRAELPEEHTRGLWISSCTYCTTHLPQPTPVCAERLNDELESATRTSVVHISS